MIVLLTSGSWAPGVDGPNDTCGFGSDDQRVAPILIIVPVADLNRVGFALADQLPGFAQSDGLIMLTTADLHALDISPLLKIIKQGGDLFGIPLGLQDLRLLVAIVLRVIHLLTLASGGTRERGHQ
jgi:hypothetical protein